MDLSHPYSSFNIEKILRNDLYSCVGQLRCRQGTAQAEIWQLSPAVHVAYLDFQTTHYQLNQNRRPNIIEINYCIQGRIEHIQANGYFRYINKNELVFARESCHTSDLFIPLGYAQVMAIVLDLDSPDMAQTFTKYTNLDILALVKNLIDKGPEFCVSLDPLFQTFYQIPPLLPEEVCRDWLLLKISELLLYLNYCPLNTHSTLGLYQRQQVEVVKAVHKELTENLSQRYTVEQLAQKYYISPSTLKNAFKSIYGLPIGTYVRRYRIERATELLRETELNVEDISSRLGYQNTSKFSAAFREITGQSPTGYRRNPREFK